MGSISNGNLPTNGNLNGNGNRSTNESPQMNDKAIEENQYQIPDVPMGTKRKIKIIFMGMGCSGINFAYQLFKHMSDVELTIYEKNDSVGGTWFENRYPGCACDIPSVCYQYTWCKKPDWSKYYSGSKEIHQYFEKVVDENNLRQHVRFEHRVTKAEWLGMEGKWKITVMHGDNPHDTFDDYADFFLHGGGVLNNWRWPEISGLESFKGEKVHTARWEESLDLTGKRVLIIGVGSSGVQVIPNIIEKVDRLHVVARSPVWITAGFAPKYAGPNGENFSYPLEMQERFKCDPEFYLSYCKSIESELNVRFKLILNDTPESIAAKKFSIAEMERKLSGRKDLIDKLIPTTFNVGCRRPTPGNGFLEALTHDKTTLYSGEIPEITSTGFVDPKGVAHDVDVIICATGFDTSFKPQFPILANGRNLQDDFDKNIVGYLGFSAPEVPNYFVFIGAYGPLGHGSVLPMVEFYTRYIIQVLEKFQVEDIKKMQVKRSAAEAFTRHADQYLTRTAWTGPCSSWFRGGNGGRKPVLWPGSRIHYMVSDKLPDLTCLEKPRFEDFEYEYWSGNPFGYLGTGFCTREQDGRDLTWYMGLIDEQDKQPPPVVL